MSHWSFVLMGLHLGLHMRVMLPKKEPEKNIRMTIISLLTILSGIGFWLFLRNNMPDYLSFKVPFALLDYEKAGLLVFVENLLTLLFFVFTGYQVSLLLVRNKNQSKAGQRNLEKKEKNR